MQYDLHHVRYDTHDASGTMHNLQTCPMGDTLNLQGTQFRRLCDPAPCNATAAGVQHSAQARVRLKLCGAVRSASLRCAALHCAALHAGAASAYRNVSAACESHSFGCRTFRRVAAVDTRRYVDSECGATDPDDVRCSGRCGDRADIVE